MKYKNIFKIKHQRFFLLMAFMCCTVSVLAGDYYCDFTVNGIFYKFIPGKTDEVAVSYDNYETGKYGGNYTNYSGFISIPSTVTYNSKTYKVTAVTDHAFYELTSVTSVSLPSTITSIGTYAFADCTSLYSINLPTSLKTIGYGAFNGCIGLSSMNIPNGVTTIDSYAFYECKNISSFSIPNTIKTVGYDAFTGTAWYNNQPNGLLYIGHVAYKYKGTMPSGTAIELKDETTEISGYAFSGCSGLASVTIPNSVTSIGYYAFNGCSGLSSVNIPDGVTSIGYYTFNGCSGLTSIIIPNSVTDIGYNAFSGCSGLTSVIIPNSVTSIGSYAFQNCRGLTSVIIPSSVTSIADYAFAYCSGLTSVTIPSSVTSIGYSSFAGCSGLTDLYCYSEEPPSTKSSSFDSFIQNTTLHVPYTSLDLYKEAAPWNTFMSIVSLPYNLLSCEEQECLVGTTPTLKVNLKNDDEVKLGQFDLQLPTGVTIATNSNGKLDVKLTERAKNHSITGKQLENGNYRFIISSMDNDSFTGNNGILLEISLDVSVTMEAGEYTVKVLNAELSVPDGNDLKVVKPADTESKLTVKTYTPGDVNNDGSVSVTDVGCAINYILEQIPSVFIFEAADMNGDMSVSVTDVGIIINMILNDGAASRQKTQLNVRDASLSLMSAPDGYQLMLENKEAFVAFQMDVQLVNGVTINDLHLNDDNDHLLTYRKLDNGSYRVVCYSPTNSSFANDETALLKISANGDVVIRNIRLTTTGLTELRPSAFEGKLTGITSVENEMQVSVQGHTLQITSDSDTTLRLYSLGGSVSRILNIHRGVNNFDGLRTGVYMIGNRKVILK